MEDRLRRLAEAGELTGLPGEGRPFAAEDLAGDDASWAAFRLMKNNRVIPGWSQDRMDIDTELDRLRSRCRAHRSWLIARARRLRSAPGDRIIELSRITALEDERFTAELESSVRELNVRIDRYNAMVPSSSLALRPVRVGALLASVP